MISTRNTHNTRNTRTPAGHSYYFSGLAPGSQGNNTHTPPGQSLPLGMSTLQHPIGYSYNFLGLTPHNQGNNTRTPTGYSYYSSGLVLSSQGDKSTLKSSIQKQTAGENENTPPPEQPMKNWCFWTVPNLLSILRLLMLAPTVWALVHKPPFNWLAFVLFVLSSVTDALDGWIARRFKQESEWGKILDPIADKLTLNVLAMILAVQGRIPLFLAIVVLGRDVVILAASLVLLTSKTHVPQSNWPGKVAGAAFFAMLCAAILNIRWLLEGFLVPVVTVLVLITLVVYTPIFFKSLKPKLEKEP